MFTIPIGISGHTKGGDIRFIPGKGSAGHEDGRIIWCDADGNDLLSLDSDGLKILGKEVPMIKILKLLETLSEHLCRCPTEQILKTGCSCGGK